MERIMNSLVDDIAYLISKDSLDIPNRKREVINKRMYLCNALHSYGYGYTFIANMFKKNHASVINAVKQYQALSNVKDPELIKDIAEYKEFLEERKDCYIIEKKVAKKIISDNEYIIQKIQKDVKYIVKNLNILNDKYKNLEI
jgi:hypothetical protein